ncbi:MAG: hypothetical protein PHC28_15850 [Flavobacterium sp.]|uniref:hypothetical protein n=1 Tax=Flavobacterium sp. TaxID=239 RepID=UPI002630CDA1|nr:hypothetical protein [Flavobacterium sp.]MDD5151926.1 hypothetical protein [Flavobacterium sp.]
MNTPIKIKVKIAVAVGPDGSWNAVGWSNASSMKEMMDIAVDEVSDGENRFWIEVELPVPQEVTIIVDKYDIEG